MHARLTLYCGAALLFLIVITFLVVPNAGAEPQGPMGLLAQTWTQPTGGTGSTEADEKALKKIRRMSPEEIKALDKKLAEALILYYDRKFARALPIFREIAGQVETMDIMFWVGTSAMEVGRTRLAIQKFKEMLAIDPKLHRVRLDLAATYFKMGRYDDARRELELVQAASPPPGVQKNIANLLNAIEERTRKLSWNIRFSEGFLWDDNVSAGPDKKELAVVGGTLTLGDESSKLKDQALATNLAGNVLYDMGEKNGLMWNTTVSYYHLVYLDHGAFNYMKTDVTTGPWWAGRRDILKIPFGYTEQDYGSDQLAYGTHVDPNYEHYFNQYFSLKGLYSYTNTNYYATENLNLNNNKYRFELTPNIYLANRKHILSATVGYERSRADARRFSYKSPFHAFSYFGGFPTGTEVFIRYESSHKDYLEKPLLYNVDREDERGSITAVLSQGFRKYYFASFAYSYMDNDSTCGLYDFDRTTYTASVGCRF